MREGCVVCLSFAGEPSTVSASRRRRRRVVTSAKSEISISATLASFVCLRRTTLPLPVPSVNSYCHVQTSYAESALALISARPLCQGLKGRRVRPPAFLPHADVCLAAAAQILLFWCTCRPPTWTPTCFAIPPARQVNSVDEIRALRQATVCLRI